MNRFNEQNLIFICFSLLFVVLNISAITMNYGFSDDYTHFFSYSTDNHIELENILFRYGRPINALLYKLFFSRLQNISGFQILRVVSLIGMLLVIFMVFDILRNQNLSNFEIFILLVLLFTIPAINLTISWASLFTLPLAMLLSILSALLLKKTLITNKKWLVKIIFYFACVVLLLISSLIHQTASMYFWVIVVIFLFFSSTYKDNSLQLVKYFMKFLIVWAISMGLSYFWILIYASNYDGQEIERINLLSNFYHKLLWFIYEVIVRSLNFHLLSDSIFLPIIFLIIIIFGLYLFFEKRSINKVIGYLVVAMLLILSYFPNLIVEENWASYRTQIALSSLFILFLFIGLKSIFSKLGFKNNSYFFNSILSIFSFLSLFLYCYHQINSIVHPQSLEISFIKYRLSEFNEEIHDEIIVIQPSLFDTLANRLYGYDEFGIPSSIQSWAPEPMVRLVLEELNYNLQNTKITTLPPKTEDNFDESIFVLDLRMIRIFK